MDKRVHDGWRLVTDIVLPFGIGLVLIYVCASIIWRQGLKLVQ